MICSNPRTGKKRGATLRIGNVTINAPSVLKHEEELEPLAAAIPSEEEQKLKYDTRLYQCPFLSSTLILLHFSSFTGIIITLVLKHKEELEPLPRRNTISHQVLPTFIFPLHCLIRISCLVCVVRIKGQSTCSKNSSR